MLTGGTASHSSLLSFLVSLTCLPGLLASLVCRGLLLRSGIDQDARDAKAVGAGVAAWRTAMAGWPSSIITTGALHAQIPQIANSAEHGVAVLAFL